MVDRISITTGRIITRDANNNVTFDSNDEYMRTDTNGQFQAGGHFSVPVVYGSGGVADIGQHDAAGGFLETTGQVAINLHGTGYALDGIHNASNNQHLALAREHNGSGETTFTFSLNAGVQAFKNSLAVVGAFHTGGGTVYSIEMNGSVIKPYLSNGNHPTANLYKSGNVVGTVMFVAQALFISATYQNGQGSFTGFAPTIVAPQYVSGDLTSGGTYTCDFYNQTNIYTWRDASGTNQGARINNQNLYWGPINIFREGGTTNLSLVKTA